VISRYIIDRIGNKVLSTSDYDTQFFDSISNESGEFTITTENVGELLRDEESMKLLLNDDLDDLKQELYSLHSNSYNSAYESEIYDDVRSELERLFVGYIIERRVVASNYDDIVVRFFERYENQKYFYNCLYTWKNGRYVYQKCEAINDAKLKPEKADSVSIEVEKILNENKLIF
jgi:hypothetical protein